MTCPECGNAVSADCLNHTTARISALLSEVYDSEGVNIWLHAEHRWFDGRRAVDLIAEGRGGEVLAAAERLVGGAW